MNEYKGNGYLDFEDARFQKGYKPIELTEKFIKENKLSVWFSVPSLAQFMNKFRMLKENSLMMSSSSLKINYTK